MAAHPHDVVRDSATGLWLLPTGVTDGSLSRWLPSWDDLEPARARLLLDVLASASAQDRAAGRAPAGRTVTRVLGLLPLPNDYSPDSVAVVLPPTGGGPMDPAGQVAWIKHDHLFSLRPAIVLLAEITGGQVGFLARFELSTSDVEELDGLDADDIAAMWGDKPIPEWEHPDVLRKHGYGIDGPRGLIADWEACRDAVLALRTEHGPARILPAVARRAAWALPTGDLVRAYLCEQGRVELELRADDGTLTAWHGDVLVSELVPGGRDFFDQTHRQVLGLGGTAPVAADTHSGSLEVWVENDRPLHGWVPDPQVPPRWSAKA